MKKNICIICGGASPEHEVSLVSSEFVYSSIDTNKYNILLIGITKEEGSFRYYGSNAYKTKSTYSSKLLDYNYSPIYIDLGSKNPLKIKNIDNTFTELKIDIFFPIAHGINCEDGTLQGLLSLLNIPYVGCKTLASALCMDKETTKKICAHENIPVVKSINLNKSIKKNLSKVKYPVFVKPSSSGSSFGISKVNSYKDLDAAIKEAYKYSNAVLIEDAIDAREIECAVLGNWNSEILASNLGEIIPNKEFYSYDAKYIDADGAKLVYPVSIDIKIQNKIKAYAIKAFRALKCNGMARVDFFLDKKTDKIYFNEINTIPGFTSISMYPKLWAESGIDNFKLVDKLLEFSLEE